MFVYLLLLILLFYVILFCFVLFCFVLFIYLFIYLFILFFFFGRGGGGVPMVLEELVQNVKTADICGVTKYGKIESKCHLISNGNRTEWSTIQGIIGRQI